MGNPFRNTIVPDPWHAGADVREINRVAFDICREALDSVLNGKHSASVLLCGEAGSGKTHLLGRLRRHMAGLSIIHGFASVRLQAGPQRFWRHIRKCLVESLLRTRQNGKSQLELIFLRRIFLICRKKRISISELEETIDRVRAESGLSGDLCKALGNIVRNRYRADAISWLKGQTIPGPVAAEIGLIPDDAQTGHPEDRAREIVHEICRLAGPSMPMIFCFDQIEALQRYPDDDKGVFAFGQAIASLHDETENVLLISCIQTLFREDLKRIIPDSDFSRLSVHETTLNPLTRRQAFKLVSSRLDTCQVASRQKKDILAAIENEIGPETDLARRILSRSAAIYDTLAAKGLGNTEMPDRDFLEEEREIREDREMLAVEINRTDEIVQDTVPVLAKILDEDVGGYDGEPPRDMNIVLKKRGVGYGISLCNHTDMKRLAARLKRLRSQFDEGGPDRLVVIRHSDREVSPGAKKVISLLDGFKSEEKIKVIYADTQTLAALETVRGLLADAKAGDLANNGKTIDYETVTDWLKSDLKGPAEDFILEIFEMEGDSRFES